MSESQSEYIEKSKTKIEQLIEKSHIAGNVSENDEIETPSKDIFMIDLDSIKEYVQYLPYLPKGFGFTGGVARGALLELLGWHPPRPRDYDAEGIADFGADNNKDSITKLDKMGVDYYKGEPIVQSLKSYFLSRDFTINEVFLYGNNLYFSRAAIQALDSKTVEFTEHELNNGYEDLDPKLVAKALLLQVEFIKLYNAGSLADLEKWKWKIAEIPAFYLAIGLDKSQSKGVPLEFLKKLFEFDSIRQDELPNGVSRSSLVRLSGLLRHWMLHPRQDERGHRDHRRDGYKFNNRYFDGQYLERWEVEDQNEFAKLQEKISRSVKYKNISTDDLDW